jgi:hypothetical protein
MADIKKLKNHLIALNESLKDGLAGIRPLQGKALEEFKDVFDIQDDVDIFFNDYNIVLIDPISFEAIKPYIKEESLALKLEIPEHDNYIWIYQYFNERIFNDYLVDSEPS